MLNIINPLYVYDKHLELLPNKETKRELPCNSYFYFYGLYKYDIITILMHICTGLVWYDGK